MVQKKANIEFSTIEEGEFVITLKDRYAYKGIVNIIRKNKSENEKELKPVWRLKSSRRRKTLKGLNGWEGEWVFQKNESFKLEEDYPLKRADEFTKSIFDIKKPKHVQIYSTKQEIDNNDELPWWDVESPVIIKVKKRLNSSEIKSIPFALRKFARNQNEIRIQQGESGLKVKSGNKEIDIEFRIIRNFKIK